MRTHHADPSGNTVSAVAGRRAAPTPSRPLMRPYDALLRMQKWRVPRMPLESSHSSILDFSFSASRPRVLPRTRGDIVVNEFSY